MPILKSKACLWSYERLHEKNMNTPKAEGVKKSGNNFKNIHFFANSSHRSQWKLYLLTKYRNFWVPQFCLTYSKFEKKKTKISE